MISLSDSDALAASTPLPFLEVFFQYRSPSPRRKRSPLVADQSGGRMGSNRASVKPGLR